MTEAIDENEFGVGDKAGCVPRVDDVDHSVLCSVEHGHRAPDLGDVEANPAGSVGDAIIRVALHAKGKHRRKAAHRVGHPVAVSEQFLVGVSKSSFHTPTNHLRAVHAMSFYRCGDRRVTVRCIPDSMRVQRAHCGATQRP